MSSAETRASEPQTPEAEEDRTVLASAPLSRALVHLCVPMICGMAVSAVYNLVNGEFIGSLGSTSLLAAVQYAMPVLTLCMGVGQLFGVGGGTLLSRLLGERDGAAASDEAAADAGNGAPIAASDDADQVSAFAFWGSIAAGALFAAAGLALLDPFVRLLGTTPDALVPTRTYAAVLLAFAPACTASLALEQLVRAHGAARASMAGSLIGTLANLALDAALILGLGWGLVGAGISVGVANLAMSAYYLVWLVRRGYLHPSPRFLRPRADLVRPVLAVGASELVSTSFLLVTQVTLNWLSFRYGDDVVAAFGLAMRVTQLPEMVCMGIYTGMVPLFAYSFGAGDTGRLSRAVRLSAAAILGVSAVSVAALLALRDPVMGSFTNDPALLDVAVRVLTALLVATLLNGFTGLFLSVFQARGDARAATVVSGLQGGLFIPVSVTLSAAFGLTGLIWSQTAAEAITFAVGAALYLRSLKSQTQMGAAKDAEPLALA